MQETTTGDVGIVYVCEGSEHNIVLRDISRWNCQNPILTIWERRTKRKGTSD